MEGQRAVRLLERAEKAYPVKGGSTELRLRRDSGGRSWTFTVLSSARPGTALSI